MGRSSPPRLLVVDDQEDVRTLLATALSLEGYDVVGARDARDGIRCLEQGRFDLVITDYAMPGGTGIWMLHEAARRGLLERTPAIVVTAHPDVREAAQEFPIARKPLDLDRFLRQVHELLQQAEKSRDDVQAGDPTVIELVLYVSAVSLASRQARRNLEKFLRTRDRSRIRLTVKDLYRDPLAGAADGIVVTPTLVKVTPAPRLWIVGSLTDRQVLDDVLAGAGFEEVN